MKMTRNEMKILFTFGCADREATVTRLFYVGSVTVDPSARKQILELAKRECRTSIIATSSTGCELMQNILRSASISRTTASDSP